jgi:uncharacterized OsmC-like protein
MAFRVVVGAGTLRSSDRSAMSFAHRWTTGGVTVEAEFTGAHLFILAAAGCVLNDVYREASVLGLDIRGVRVSAEGDFEPDTWRSTRVSYAIDVDSDATEDRVEELLTRVDAVAEIPKAMRLGASVERHA